MLNASASEATTTVTDGSITMAKLSSDVKENLGGNTTDLSAYYCATAESGTLANDGTVGSGNGFVTEHLPVIPSETLVLGSELVVKVAFYTKTKTYISSTSVTSGLNNYTVPSNAYFARYQLVYANGNIPPRPFEVRRRETPENKTFFDLIKSPIQTVIDVGVTGDSNTAGYGLPSGSYSWAVLLGNAISADTEYKYNCTSGYTENIGATRYSSGFNFKKNSEFSIWTDASSITISIASNYSSAWKWLVDGTESGTASSTTLTLDGNFHKVTAQFTSGQAVNPAFTIAKTITFTNSATSGVSSQNVNIPTGKDWLLIMIGTNDRRGDISGFKDPILEYYQRGTFIVPFPNHKTDSSYTHSELETYSSLMFVMKNLGFEIVNCSSENAFAFYDDTLYQSDKIHISAKGHRLMANIIGGKLGFPIYLKDES